jgi:hypothetical protein
MRQDKDRWNLPPFENTGGFDQPCPTGMGFPSVIFSIHRHSSNVRVDGQIGAVRTLQPFAGLLHLKLRSVSSVGGQLRAR